MDQAEPAREAAAVVPENADAAAYARAIAAERAGFLPALIELERLQVCARCCLRFAGVRSDAYIRPAPPVALLRRALEEAAAQDAAAGSPAAGQLPDTAVNGSDSSAAPSAEAAQAPANGHTPAEPVCRACLGVLQSLDGPLHTLPPDAFAKLPETDGAGARWRPLAAGDPPSIVAHIREQQYESRAFALEISVPGSAQLRQLALWRHLQALPACAGLFPGEGLRDDVVDLKESLRLPGVLAEQLEPRLGQPLDPANGDLRITANYIHPASAAETDFLFARPFGGRSQKRKRRRTDTLEVGRSSSETISAAAARFPPNRLRAECHVPPGPAPERVSLMLSCRRTPTYVGGCYRKLQRDVSQSPWVIDGTRKGRTSVQEEIERVLLPALRCDGAKFITAGREDIDVRMLGDGRPFVLEVQNQRAAMPPPERFAAIERQLAESGVGVEVRKLQPVTKDLLQAIKDGEQRKQKSYRALCELPCEATPEVLARLNGCGEVELAQETPARVAHRRALLVRHRTVHSLAVSRADAPEAQAGEGTDAAAGAAGEGAGRRVVLHLRTQAGTYVKEFVHGDEGRTRPSLGSLAGCETPARILELDVLGVHMDFL